MPTRAKTPTPAGLALAERLTRLRQERGLTQSDLAARAGTQGSYISRIEQGLHPNPSARRLGGIAAALSVGIGDLAPLEPERVERAHGGDAIALLDMLERTRRQMEVFAPVVLVPVVNARTGEPERFPYWPLDPAVRRRTARLRALVARGQCLAPDVLDGDVLVYDAEGPVAPGRLVVLARDGDVLVRRLRADDAGGLRLEANREWEPVPLTGEYRREGVVVFAGRHLA